MRISLIFFTLLMGLLSLPARERPLSFVSDPSFMLPEETRESLDLFLRTRSHKTQSEIFLLLEPLPEATADESKAILKDLGHSWSEKNWAIIAYRPGQINPPLIVAGGPLFKEVNPSAWEKEITTLQDLSLQSWQNTPDIDFLARKLSDSLVFFSQFKSATIQSLTKNRNEEFRKKYRSHKSKKALILTISTLSLLALGLLCFLSRKAYLAKRKMFFPETNWTSRLGAPHSGGSAAAQRFTPPSE